jgi:carbohydrate-selective porin OprB
VSVCAGSGAGGSPVNRTGAPAAWVVRTATMTSPHAPAGVRIGTASRGAGASSTALRGRAWSSGVVLRALLVNVSSRR